MPDDPTRAFLQGIAMTLAELSRRDGADLARQLADQWELSLPDFGPVRVDESDLVELRRVFSVAPASDAMSSR